MSPYKGSLLFIGKFTKLTMLNFTNLGPWEADSIKIFLRYSITKEMSIFYCIAKNLKVSSLLVGHAMIDVGLPGGFN